MKYVISLSLGFVIGIVLFVGGLLYNPFFEDSSVSPLSVSDAEIMSLGFSAAPSETIVYSNNGESSDRPHPEKVLQLWEAPIRSSSVMATLLFDARGRAAGIGIKFSSRSERTSLLDGQALVDSVWHVYLPERGSVFIQQSENFWSYLRDIVLPAYRSPANNWKGQWMGHTTAGPHALGMAAASGGSGALQGLEMNAIESLTATAFSTSRGLLSAEGRLVIELPVVTDEDDSASIE
ncbi:MAG TPA: hypothetical protein VIS31_12365 [Woeseiaceae bacterium]